MRRSGKDLAASPQDTWYAGSSLGSEDPLG